MVADFVCGVAEHQDNLLAALCDTAQADGKTVAAEDGENDTDSVTAELVAYIGGNIVYTCVVALGTGHNGFGHGHNVPVTGLETIVFHSCRNAVADNFCQVVSR